MELALRAFCSGCGGPDGDDIEDDHADEFLELGN